MASNATYWLTFIQNSQICLGITTTIIFQTKVNFGNDRIHNHAASKILTNISHLPFTIIHLFKFIQLVLRISPLTILLYDFIDLQLAEPSDTTIFICSFYIIVHNSLEELVKYHSVACFIF